MPYLESGYFDVMRNTFWKVGDYMIDKCARLVCCPGWFMYMLM